MSNYKISLETNNTALSANNIALQSLIDQANNLPDASGVSGGNENSFPYKLTVINTGA